MVVGAVYVGVLVAGGVYGPHPSNPHGGAEQVLSHRHPRVHGTTEGTLTLTEKLEELSANVVVDSPNVAIEALFTNTEVGVLGNI